MPFSPQSAALERPLPVPTSTLISLVTVDLLLKSNSKAEILVWIFSPPFKAFDRGIKFDRYREIDSLKEYLLIHSDAATVEHYSRQPDNSWIYRESKGLDFLIVLPALNTTLSSNHLFASTLPTPV